MALTTLQNYHVVSEVPMTRKTLKWSLFAGLFLLLLVGGIVVLAAFNVKSPRVTRGKFEMIQIGMTMDEVERLMDMPQHDRLEPENYDWDYNSYTLPTAIYADEYAMIEISVNEECRVYYKNFGTRRRGWLNYANEILGW